MSGVTGNRASLGQGKGPDVELTVTGTPLYANYETADGFPVVYDEDLELFCYARLKDGGFESTGVPVSAPPPPDARPHARESEDVRAAKIEARSAHLDRRSTTEEE